MEYANEHDLVSLILFGETWRLYNPVWLHVYS